MTLMLTEKLRPYRWYEVDKETFAPAFKLLNEKIFQPGPLDYSSISLRASKLPFYESCELLQIRDSRGPLTVRRLAVFGPSGVVLLDKTADAVYLANGLAKLQLNEQTAAPYAAFFLNHVIGPYGRMNLLGNGEQLPWVKEVDPEVRRQVRELVAPPKALPEQNGQQRLLANLVFGNALLKAEITIDRDGRVDLPEDRSEVLLTDLPLLPDDFAVTGRLHLISRGQIY